jgi:hypothetical protein
MMQNTNQPILTTQKMKVQLVARGWLSVPIREIRGFKCRFSVCNGNPDETLDGAVRP